MDEELTRLVFVCPYHGRIPLEAVTTMKTCGECMEEFGIDAGAATILRRVPFEKHEPRWKYDCERCKFAANCGPQCECFLHEKQPPEERLQELKEATRIRREGRGR